MYILIDNNSKQKRDQREYTTKYNELADKSNKVQAKIDKLNEKIKSKEDSLKVLEKYIQGLKSKQATLNEFDKELFYALVDRVKVNKDGIVIVWKDGAES